MASLLPVSWFNLLFTIVPLAYGVAIVRELLLVRRLRSVGIEIVGRVVHQREVESRNGAYFVPTISFTTLLGQLIEAESAVRSSGFEFFDGDEVVLYYDPDEPGRFLLYQQMAVNSKYWQLAIAALLLLLVLVGAKK
ncbi:hypothetical protein FNT36_14330 [Hymenobacter setariae]|uniref:DUF3592 domain-containing protein n=1 Tax=Hymenobacter setariae TaxID=2594794 RepID=A0A558BVW2_9BACT|nr:DUF3592 domain-containing protein [Hymenobacter setariae]TVT40642.1 hypothetical protein FNT36_14330 [Hymenobacter setariae]